MARFIIIDNWLDSIGGHNYQYAVEILRAAAAAGHEPWLVTARSLTAPDAFPDEWQLRPLFRYAWNRTHTVGVDGKRTRPIDLDGRELRDAETDRGFRRWITPVIRRLSIFQQLDRKRRIKAFGESCEKLFDEIGFCPEDTIFLPSVSDFDFLGLASFLTSNTQSQNVHWHIQFHYDIFDGRPPDYPAQELRRENMRQQFSHALASIQRHQLHFYATTPQIANQYNLLQVAHFQSLPYPISSALADSTKEADCTPSRLRVTLAGGVRREKGKHGLAAVLEPLRSGGMLDNDIQLWMQGDLQKIAKNLSHFGADTVTSGKVTSSHEEPIVVVPHPLDCNDYLKLIRQSDIALLPYNNTRYHARASGVLVEMLAAGVPVIVPAGCWLAAQVSESIYEHLDRLSASQAKSQRTADIEWEDTASHDNQPSIHKERSVLCFAGADRPAVADLEIVKPTAEMIFRFYWTKCRPGYYVRLRVEQTDVDGLQLTDSKQIILGGREKEGPVSALLRLDPRVNRIRITLTNAYHNDLIEISRPYVDFFSGSPEGLPSGAVGLVAADLRQIPELLREMVQHYEHYSRSAAKFRTSWNHKHAPQRTIEALAANNGTQVSAKTAA